jgi:hypothetical protein
MAYTNTITRTATVTATEARVRSVLQKVRVDLLAAFYRGMNVPDQLEQHLDDISYMLQKNALRHFEVRVSVGGQLHRAWRYEVSDDGRLLGAGEEGGGIDFYQCPAASSITLVISRRPDLHHSISQEIIRRGWTDSVVALQGAGVRERAYEKDGYGVIRTRFDPA